MTESVDKPELERYVLNRVLKQSDSGSTWLAVDKRDAKRKVVIKLVGSREAAQRESRIAHFYSPNLPALLDVLEVEERYAVILQFVEGCPLADLIRESRDDDHALEPAEATQHVLTLARVLSRIHESGLVHADIAPHNVLIGDEQAVLIDFGSATAEGAIPQTASPLYAAPEVLQQQPICPKADVFSLGAVFYEMLTGVSLKTDTGRRSAPWTVTESVPQGIITICDRMMSDDVATRFPNMDAVIEALECAMQTTASREHAKCPRCWWRGIVVSTSLIGLAWALHHWSNTGPVATLPSTAGEEIERKKPEEVAQNIVSDADMFAIRGAHLLSTGDAELAAACFREAFKYDANCVRAHLGMGWVFYGKNLDHEARLSFQRVLACDDVPDAAVISARHALGAICRRVDSKEEAIPWFEASLELEPTCPADHFYRAWSLWYLKRDKEAAEECLQAMSIERSYRSQFPPELVAAADKLMKPYDGDR